jgi:hypothetical protein
VDADAGDARPGADVPDAADGGDASEAVDAPASMDGGSETRAPGSFPDYASGTRLRARIYKNAEGAALWHGWQDSERGETCTFQTADDGRLRCLPANPLNEQRYFADEKCLQPLILGLACATPGYLAVPLGRCMTQTSIYKKVAKVTPTMVFTGTSDSCGGPLAPPAAYDLYSTVAQPAAAFVAATEVHDPRGALMARYYQADDGALQPLSSAFDPVAAQACGPSTQTVDLPDRCAPSQFLVVSTQQPIYGDATCATPLLYTPFLCAAPSAGFVYEGSAPTCSHFLQGTFYRLGAKNDGDTFAKMNGMCQQVPPSADLTSFAFGAQVPVSDIPAVKRVDVGAGRVKLRYLASATNDKIFAMSFFDSTTGLPCTARMAGGALRCIPLAEEEYHYTDNGCSTPIYAQYNAMAGCALPPPPAYVISSPFGPACNSVQPQTDWHLYSVGSRNTTLSLLYAHNVDGCVADGDPKNIYAGVFDLTEVPQTELGALTDVIE